MKLLLFFAAVWTVVTASSSNSSCIAGCTCEDARPSYSRIFACEGSLVLTKDSFTDTPKNILTIKFENNDIINISEDAFSEFPNLETIVFQDSVIGSLDKSAFNLLSMNALTFIRITFKEIPELISDNLEELMFDECHLNKSPILDHLVSLRYLNLANNQIQEIDKTTFAQLDALEELWLTNNSITTIAPNAFVYNEDLNALYLGYNPIESLELSHDLSLEILALQFCKLKTFGRSTSKHFDLLTSLDLSYNQIDNLPIDAFQGMTSLQTINLSSNLLVELDDDIFYDNSNLLKIILDNNKFDALPKFQSNETFRTYEFSCNNCTLTSLANKPFEKMNDMEILSLRNNQLNDMEGGFNSLVKLRKLHLSDNLITSVSVDDFSKKNSLELLELSNNPLKPLHPGVFANIGLTTLDVSNASLTQLWANNNTIILSLRRLLIADNNLTALTVADLSITPNIYMLDVTGNPLQCTKDLESSILWLIKMEISAAEIKTHEEQTLPTNAAMFDKSDSQASWKNFAFEKCPEFNLMIEDYIDDIGETAADVSSNDDMQKYKYPVDENDYNEYYDDEFNIADEDDKQDNIDDSTLDESENDDNDNDDDLKGEEYYDQMIDSMKTAATILDEKNEISATNSILQLTSVFVLTALLVSIFAVVLILCILKKNKAFNVHNGNLPRLKIPLWQPQLGQKKHSGSVYKPLSEDLSGPKTPIFSRYEFKQQPTVHNSIP